LKQFGPNIWAIWGFLYMGLGYFDTQTCFNLITPLTTLNQRTRPHEQNCRPTELYCKVAVNAINVRVDPTVQ